MAARETVLCLVCQRIEQVSVILSFLLDQLIITNINNYLLITNTPTDGLSITQLNGFQLTCADGILLDSLMFGTTTFF